MWSLGPDRSALTHIREPPLSGSSQTPTCWHTYQPDRTPILSDADMNRQFASTLWARGIQARTQEGTEVCAQEMPDTLGPPNTKETSWWNQTRGELAQTKQGFRTSGLHHPWSPKPAAFLDTQITQLVPAIGSSSPLFSVRRATVRRGHAVICWSLGPWLHGARKAWPSCDSWIRELALFVVGVRGFHARE